jgi:hypothetical protein
MGRIFSNNTSIILFSFLLLILIAVAFVIFKILNRFIQGDLGEQSIKRILEKLPQNYYCLSDFVKEEKGNIDHIVVGESGIWTIEVKNKSGGAIIHDKYLDKDLRQAFAEAKELESILVQLGYAIPVTPVLVFANKKTRLNFGMRPINGVYVIGKSWLEELLTKHSGGHYLAPGQSYAIKEKLKLYTSRF